MHATSLFSLFALLPFTLAGVAPNARQPSWCAPVGDKTASYENTWWDDESSVCAAQGVAEHCCTTFVGGGICGGAGISGQSLTDLLSAVAQQSKKSKQFASTTVGEWIATFTLFEHDVQNPNILIEFDHGIQSFAQAAKTGVGQVSEVYLQAYGGGKTTVIHVNRSCK